MVQSILISHGTYDSYTTKKLPERPVASTESPIVYIYIYIHMYIYMIICSLFVCQYITLSGKKEKRVFCCPYTSLVYWKYKLNWLKPHKNKNKKTMFSRLVWTWLDPGSPQNIVLFFMLFCLFFFDVLILRIIIKTNPE